MKRAATLSDPLRALRAAADSSRLRLLRLLDVEELNVGELAQATDLPQSGVSRHLATLRAAGLVEERTEGVRTYARVASAPAAETAPLLAAVLAAVRADGFGHAEDLVRLQRVKQSREQQREAMFDSIAEDWDALRGQLLGGRLSAPEMASFLAPAGMHIVDAGAGTGLSLPWLSAVAGPDGRVVAVERSPAMAARARERVADLANVEVRRGRIEDLPVPDGWADALLLSLALRQTSDPVAALARCVRAVKPGGRVVVADVETHGDATLVERLGPGFAGFAADELVATMMAAGLDSVRLVASAALPTETNGARAPRTPTIPRLAPLVAVGIVPSSRRVSARRKP